MGICTNCGAKMTPGTMQCGFCRAVVTMTTEPSSTHAIGQVSDGAWHAYYALSALYILAGLGLIGLSCSLIVQQRDFSIGPILGGLLGAVMASLGFGLIWLIEWVRKIAVVFFTFQIVAGLLGFLYGVCAGFTMGEAGWLTAISCLVQAALAGTMIFLIGETD